MCDAMAKELKSAMAQNDDLNQALREFETTLADLESACAELMTSPAASPAELHLRQEIDALRGKAAALSDAGRQALARVDAAMARIRAVLGEEDG